MAESISSQPSRRDWFLFADRSEYAPDAGGMITTHAFRHRSQGSMDSLDWETEEWSVCAGLIPMDQLSPDRAPAADRAAKSIRAHHELEFRPWWRDGSEFDFGDARYVNGVIAWPWLHHWPHRLDDRRIVIVPRTDFLRYHALDYRPFKDFKDGAEYVQPLENTVVMRTGAQQVAYFNPMPFAQVQRDYLRDYLAARRAALLLAVVAERVAHAPSVAELELESVEDHQVGDNAWIATTIHEQSPHNRELAMGRSVLHWNIVLSPYDKPKPRRSPWAFHDEYEPDEHEPVPFFIVSPEAARLPADRAGIPYLYFSPRVLDRYLRTPGYGAAFHMRTWGGVWTPYGNVDVGINSRGLVNAFMPDIAQLPVGEQQHWAIYSVLPDGEICEAMVQTRMQQRPPHLPGVIELMSDAMRSLRDAIREKFQVELYGIDLDDAPEQSGRLSIGPLSGQLHEVAELAVPLYAWVIQAMDVTALRSVLKQHCIEVPEKGGQIVLLRTILSELAGLPADDTRQVTGPLTAVNELRAKAAHVAEPDFEAVLPMLGLPAMPSSPREFWDSLVDAVAQSLQMMTALVRSAKKPGPANQPGKAKKAAPAKKAGRGGRRRK
jgi:hypothetical protein